nr:tyrosine-type recombinase/integrase [Catenulispora pinisilvae]
MASLSQGSVFKRCGCRIPGSSTKWGSRCPQLGERGHGSWYVAVELPAGSAGRRRVRRGGFTSRAAACEALEELLGPASTVSAGVLVREWLNTWLDTRITVRPSTLRSYQAICANHLIPYLGAVPLAALSPRQVEAMLAGVRRHSAVWGRPVTDATVQRIHATLRTALNAAMREQLIDVNPAKAVRLPRIRRPLAVVWTPDRIAVWQATGERPAVAVWTAGQTAAFLAGIREHRLYAVLHLIALRGLRRGEAAGLRWCDLDLDSATMFVSHQVQNIGGRVVQCPTKTPSSRRVVALDRTTVAVLRRHRVQQQIEHEQLGVAPSGFVFTTTTGAPLTPDRLTRVFLKLLDVSGLPPVRLHDLRHGAASLALQAGADLKVVQDQLGHSSIVTTADTYVSVLPEVARKAAEDTAALVLKAGRLVPGTRRIRRADKPDHRAHRGTANRGRKARGSQTSVNAQPARPVKPRDDDPDPLMAPV